MHATPCAASCVCGAGLGGFAAWEAVLISFEKMQSVCGGGEGGRGDAMGTDLPFACGTACLRMGVMRMRPATSPPRSHLRSALSDVTSSQSLSHTHARTRLRGGVVASPCPGLCWPGLPWLQVMFRADLGRAGKLLLASHGALDNIARSANPWAGKLLTAGRVHTEAMRQ